MALLKQVESGKLKLIVSLMHHQQEIEWTACNLEEARLLLSKRMAKGWHYAMLGQQFGPLAYGEQHDEILEAMGFATNADAGI